MTIEAVTTPARPRGLRLVLALLALAVAPALLWIASERMLAARGPAWGSFDFDPSYIYLLNSLLVAEGRSPGHTDHPGTPVQAFGAVGLVLLHPSASAEERAKAVLAAPEAHLHTLVRISTVLAGLIWFAAGWVFWRQGGSLLVALACQALPLAFHQTSVALGWFTPELLFLPLSGWLTILVATATGPTPATGWRPIVSTGLFIATAVMTKVTWIPLAAVLVLFPASWKARGWTALAAAAATGAWLLFLLPEIARTVGWLTQVATHTGHYGEGPSGLPQWSAYRETLANLWSREPMHLWLLLVAGLGLLPPLLRRRPAESSAPAGVRMLGLLLLGCAGVLLVAAKHPSGRYILPIAMAAPAIACLALTGIAAISPTAGRRCANGIAAALLIATAFLGVGSLQRLEPRLLEAQTQRVETERLCRLHPEARLVHFYRGASVAYALRFANSFAHEQYAEPLRRLYPGAISFNVFNAKFEFFNHWIEPSAFFADATPVLMIGSEDLTKLPFGHAFPLPPDWQLRRLETPGIHSLFLLTPSRQP